LTTIFTMFLFYVTPILYPVTMIPAKYRYVIDLNPLAPLMISWRSLFLEGTLKVELLATSLAYGITAYMVGYFIYKKLYWKFAEVL
jgi:lipopolysaccharide transport system permease protein